MGTEWAIAAIVNGKDYEQFAASFPHISPNDLLNDWKRAQGQVVKRLNEFFMAPSYIDPLSFDYVEGY